jgi:hypothetical protein
MTDRPSTDRYRTDRRSVLTSMAAGGFGLPAASRIDLAAPDRETTPHTDGTYRALVDLVLPPTPELADELGEEHEPGGAAVGLTPLVISFLDAQVTVPTPTQFEESAPLSTTLAGILDEAASELLARGENADDPDPTRFEGGGTFASLSRADRRRAVSLGEGREDVALLVRVAVAAPMFVYYSERVGYEDYDDRENRSFEADVQGWRQTGYEGRRKGHSVLVGYELEEATDEYEVSDDADLLPTPEAADERVRRGGRR